MSLFTFQHSNNEIQQISETSFGQEGILERQDLQQALKQIIEAIVPDVLIVAEEYSGQSKT